MNPKLSVITINLNDATGLDKTIHSVVNQSFKNFEYIVIDGKSTDGSHAVIEKYKSGITVSIIESDNGIYQAMNKGIRIAKGDYLLFINSGDTLNGHDILSLSVPQIQNEDLISCDLKLVTGTESSIKTYPDQPSFKYFLNDSLPHPATFIKRSLFEKTNGYDEHYKICSDWAFFVTMICLNHATYKHLPVILSEFHLDGISSSKNYSELQSQERKKILSEQFSAFTGLIKEWEEGQKLNYIFRHSRIIKLARKLGFIKPPKEFPPIY